MLLQKTTSTYFKCCNNTTYRISSVAHILYATYVYELLDIYHFVSSFIIPYHSNHIVLYLGLQFIWTLLHVGRLSLISGPNSCSHVLHGKYLIKTVSTWKAKKHFALRTEAFEKWMTGWMIFIIYIVLIHTKLLHKCNGWT